MGPPLQKQKFMAQLEIAIGRTVRNMAKRPRLPRPVPVQEVVRGILSPGDRDGLELRQQIRRVWEAVVPAGARRPGPAGGPAPAGTLGGGQRQPLGPGTAIPQAENSGGPGPGPGTRQGQRPAGAGGRGGVLARWRVRPWSGIFPFLLGGSSLIPQYHRECRKFIPLRPIIKDKTQEKPAIRKKFWQTLKGRFFSIMASAKVLSPPHRGASGGGAAASGSSPR